MIPIKKQFVRSPNPDMKVAVESCACVVPYAKYSHFRNNYRHSMMVLLQLHELVSISIHILICFACSNSVICLSRTNHHQLRFNYFAGIEIINTFKYFGEHLIIV
jgi:hypothetical protein